MNRDEALQIFKSNLWQPFTQMKLTPDPVLITRAEGVNLYDQNGNKIIDAIGSWWVNVHGHTNPEINGALNRQLKEFEHVMFAGFVHEGALRLSQRLAATTDNRLPRVFFSDNGSTAVEVALKMAFQYFSNSGRSQKREIVALEHGYHGDTIGAMAVGARSVFHKMYEPLLFDVHSAQSPAENLEGAIANLEDIFKANGDKICAMILEPLLQGAGGMKIYSAEYLSAARRLCDRNEAFLIYDEVFTGCGRTGSFYAAERSGVWPDLMALSKGLSGGYLPFAATLASEKIYQGFYSDNREHTLFHGHSMTGSALGCAAANASLDLFEKSDVVGMVGALEKEHEKHTKQVAAGPLGKHIRDTRFLGSVGVIEIDLPGDYTSEFNWRFWQKAIERGVLLRPLGNAIYLAPPYLISADELARCYEVLETTALELLGSK